MDDNKNIKEDEVTSIANEFLETIEKVESIFGSNGSFRRWLPDSKKW